MTCAQARERMLTADPAELRQGGDSALARHLAHCERCASMAATLTRELTQLDTALEEYARAGDPVLEAQRALARSREGAEPETGIERSSPETRVHEPRPVVDLEDRLERRGRRRGWAVGLGGVAAAAAIAALLWTGGPEELPPGGVPPGPTGDAGNSPIRPRVAVQPPDDQTAVVMATGNPEITIVWLYPREES